MASIRGNTPKSGEPTWSVLYRVGKRQASKTFQTQVAAEEWRDLVHIVGVEKALAWLADDAPNTGPTVDELFEQWIAWKRDVEKRVTARTLKDYRRDYDNWIRPRLGNRPADGVDELDVQKWVDWMGTRLDAKSVGDRHMLLGQMYRFGVARSRRLVAQNPCLETALPSKKKKAPKGFTLAQWEAMHAWGQRHEPDADDLLLFIASTGWRWQESAPIRVSSVEDYGDVEALLPDGTHVSVPQVFVAVDRVVRRTEWDTFEEAEGEAKSRAGVRRVNLPPAAARMVRRRLIGKGPGDYLFSNPRGHRWHANNFLEREFQRILDGAGIEKVKGMGPHYLRHAHVMMLDRAGVSLAKTQRRIGHESISTTIGVYGGMIDNTLAPTELAALDAMTAPVAATAVVAGEVVATPRGIAGSGE